jgi:GNAT superfamily N-acetyltransferase
MICELLGPARVMALDALAELRPDVPDLSVRVLGQAQHGYRLAGVVVSGDSAAVAVAGFRIAENLAWGRHLYVDDLVTREAFRGQGHARSLMGWLVEQVRHEGCTQMHLDSGVGPARHDAHALYHAVGLRITSHHFAGHIPALPAPSA